MKLILDMASILQTGLRMGTDKEHRLVMHEGKEFKVNTAGYAYENAVGYMVAALDFLKLHPADLIMVFEGKDTKRKRLQILPTYKSKRSSKPEDYYVEYRKVKEMVETAFRDLGALAVTQDLAEGDDVLDYFSEALDEDMVIGTNDSDLSKLNKTNRFGRTVRVMNGLEFGKLPENVFEAHHVTLYKTLVGDSSDSLQGLKGFGAKAWLSLLAKYGGDGIDEIAALIEKNDANTLSKFAIDNKCKLLAGIVDNWNSVRQHYRVVSLHPEWVNTRYFPLDIRPGVVRGKVSDERLAHFKGVRRLVTAENYDQALLFLQETVKEHKDLPVSFDLETSSGDESDAWLEAKGQDDGVDPIGSKIAGFSLSFGPGGRFTYYVSVNHYDTANIKMSQARRMIEAVHSKLKPIHNTSFELALLYIDNAKDEDGTLWRDHWKDEGQHGFLPNVDDTLLMASYVDENSPQRGLKYLSKHVLGYEQTDFNTMRTFKIDTPESKPWPGGKIMTRVLREPVLNEAGEQEVDKNGKPKTRAVKLARYEPVLDAEQRPVYENKRITDPDNPLRKKTVSQQKMRKIVETQTYLEVVYKMHEMPAKAVFDYGCDDTICTMAYWHFARVHMMLDEHLHVYRKVEISAAYLHTKNYIDGFKLDMHELLLQKAEDNKLREEQEKVLHTYLIEKGWLGTQQPTYMPEITPAQVKEAYGIVMGIDEADEDDETETEADPVMSMRIRMQDKIVALIEAQDRDGAEVFAGHLKNLYGGDAESFNKYIGEYFDGKPKFKYSNKQMAKLLYETIGATVKVRNKVTPAMRRAGIREGNPKADALAVDYAIIEATTNGNEKVKAVLSALKLIVMVNTREALFYRPYPNFIHWLTGKVHSTHRQCSANTRRASAAEPNTQQLPAHAKIEGYESTFRRVVLPHVKNAVIVAMDFNAQELRLTADDSQDTNMLACYVGASLKDMHSITGSGIALKSSKEMQEAYAEFVKNHQPAEAQYLSFKSLEVSHPKVYKEYRGLGKKVNFTALYGAMAPKLAATLMVEEDEAQMFLDAREEAFSGATKWKNEIIIAEAREKGYVRSKLGAKRHLAALLDSNDRSVSSKAERQAANFRIQGSAAEMTKLAEGRMWEAGIFSGKYNAVCIGPIHDEVVASVHIDDLVPFLQDMHAAMVQPYADMKVPIMSSIDIGPNFYDTYDLGMEVNPEKVLEAVEKMREDFPAAFA